MVNERTARAARPRPAGYELGEEVSVIKRLFLLFLLVPTIELTLLLIMAHYLGWGWTLLFTVISSLLGAYLAKVGGQQWWSVVRDEWGQEGFPVQRIGEGALLLLSMAFLITPGPLTGVIGLVFLIPKVRKKAARWIVRWLSRRFMDRVWR